MLSKCCQSCTFCQFIRFGNRTIEREKCKTQITNAQKKPVNDDFIANRCHYAPPEVSVLNAAQNHPVEGRLQGFWQAWATLGSSPRVVPILKGTTPYSSKSNSLWPEHLS